MSAVEGVDALLGCRPPKEFEGYRWHWLSYYGRPPKIATWTPRHDGSGEWSFVYPKAYTSAAIHKAGWRYVAPAIPPEIKS